MYEILKALAAANGWVFDYGRSDFQNLFEAAEQKAVSHIFLDPVGVLDVDNDAGVTEQKIYSGSFMILYSSNIDELSYDARYQNYIKPIVSGDLRTINNAIRCTYEGSIESWDIAEVINMFDYNLDGVICTYKIRLNDEEEAIAPQDYTSLNTVNVYEILKALAASNDWVFDYGRSDYHNLFKGTEQKGVSHIFLDPVDSIDINNDSGFAEQRIYSGAFMILNSSNIDELSYEDRYIDYIKPLESGDLKVVKDAIRCGYKGTVESWKYTEVINQFDYNFDGLLCTYKIRLDFEEVQPPYLVTAIIPADGLSLVLTYSQALDEASVPSLIDYIINGTASVFNLVSIIGSQVIFTFDVAVNEGEVILLDYTAGTNPVRNAEELNAANLTAQNITNNSLVSVAGCDGLGQDFNGIDQDAHVADNGALDVNQATTDFCFGGWIKIGDDITTAQRCIGKGNSILTNGRYSISINNSRLRTVLQTSDGTVGVDSGIISINTEYHAFVRLDLTGKKIYFYIDGVLQNRGGTAFTGVPASLGSSYKYYLGAGNDGGTGNPARWAECQLRDQRVYHKDVTANQAELMAGEKLGDEVAWWCLPDLEDISDNSYDLTGVNL